MRNNTNISNLNRYRINSVSNVAMDLKNDGLYCDDNNDLELQEQNKVDIKYEVEKAIDARSEIMSDDNDNRNEDNEDNDPDFEKMYDN